MKLTIYHDGQFWVGIAEEIIDGRMRAVKHVFGAEPLDQEVLDFVNHHLFRLFSETKAYIQVPRLPAKKYNPKRLLREAAREVKTKGVGTYAQLAVKASLEQRKKAAEAVSKEQQELEEERKWQLKVKKAKARHRGR